MKIDTMNCIEPLPIVSSVPMESLWDKLPFTTYVHISTSRWGWGPNPLLGWTKSSFITLKIPKPWFLGFEYSAKEKWNLDFNQFLLFQYLLFISFGLFPNHCGLGSDIPSLELLILRNKVSIEQISWISLELYIDDMKQIWNQITINMLMLQFSINW